MSKIYHSVLALTVITLVITLTGWVRLPQPAPLPTLTATSFKTPGSPLPTPTQTPVPVSPLVTPTRTRVPTFPTASATQAPTATNTPAATPTAVTARVAGKVLHQGTQAGIPDVLMSLAGTDTVDVAAAASLAAGSVYTTTTDLNGSFVFPAVKLGVYTLAGTKAGIVMIAPVPLTISGEQSIDLPPLLAITGPAKLYLPLVSR